ncbi:hypothetical protein D3C81_1495340 [compost metagenome]
MGKADFAVLGQKRLGSSQSWLGCIIIQLGLVIQLVYFQLILCINDSKRLIFTVVGHHI